MTDITLNPKVIKKEYRQLMPSSITNKGRTSGMIVAPTLVPELKIPVAKALSFLGNHSATVLIQEGKFPASPIPKPNRAIEKPIQLKDLVTAACKTLNIAQIPMDSEYPFLVTSLSTNPPITN